MAQKAAPMCKLVAIVLILVLCNNCGQCTLIGSDNNALLLDSTSTVRLNYYRNLYSTPITTAATGKGGFNILTTLVNCHNNSHVDIDGVCDRIDYRDYPHNETDQELSRAVNSLPLTANGDLKEANVGEDEENDLLRILGAKILSLQTPFLGVGPVGDDSSPVSGKCRGELQRYLNGLKDFQLWAVQMLDSGAKIPAGILNGNVNQYGDFDNCLAIRPGHPLALGEQQPVPVQGKYCLAYLQPEVVPSAGQKGLPQHQRLHKRIQSHGIFHSEFDDPGHRVPRISTINWALCLPAGCSHLDAEIMLKDSLANFTKDTRINFKVRVEEEMCQVYESLESKIDNGTIYTLIFFGAILFMSLLMTLYDHLTPDANDKNEWLVTFSLKKNLTSLLNTKRDSNDIASVHGIRFINAVMLLVAHKSMALFFQPYVNRTEMSEILGRPWTVIGRAASLYTDPFIMLSGLLTTYSLYGRLERKRSIRVVQEYVGRLLRIVPTLGALILFCTFVLPLLGSGPQWNLVVKHHATICKSYWWRNLLFIHNYFGFENMCLTHTHHVGIDTQLFVLAPLFAWGLWRWPKRTLQWLLALATISTAARYYVTMNRNLSNYVFFGTSVRQLFDTANFMYILPAHRLTVYAMGVGLGYLLRKSKGKRLTDQQLRIGWYTNTVLIMAAFFGPAPMGSIDYKYNATHAAHYAAVAPIAWCSFFAWVIYTSHLGHHSWVSRFFSWRGYMVTTRLSYAIYLTQFPVFFYNVGVTRSTEYYEFIRLTVNMNELLWIVLTSAILTVFFDLPFGNIKKLMFRESAKQTRQQQPQVGERSTNNSDNVKITAVDGDGSEKQEATLLMTLSNNNNNNNDGKMKNLNRL